MTSNLVIIEPHIIADTGQMKDEPMPMEQDDSKEKIGKGGSRRSGKRGRKPAKVDVKAKLERSRQSARECRARKKLRYQYLEELVACRERAIHALREELDIMKKVCSEVDRGEISQQTLEYIEREKQRQARRQQQRALAKERPRQLSTSSVVSTCSEQE